MRSTISDCLRTLLPKREKMDQEERVKRATEMLAHVNLYTTSLVLRINEDLKAAEGKGEPIPASVLLLSILTAAVTFARSTGMPIDALHAGIDLAYEQTVPMNEVPAAIGGGKLDG